MLAVKNKATQTASATIHNALYVTYLVKVGTSACNLNVFEEKRSTPGTPALWAERVAKFLPFLRQVRLPAASGSELSGTLGGLDHTTQEPDQPLFCRIQGELPGGPRTLLVLTRGDY